MKKTLLALCAIFFLTFVASAADISGKWTVDTSAAPAGGAQGRGGGMGMQTYEFKVSGTTLTGSVTRAGFNGGDPVVTPIADGKLAGDAVSFTVTNKFNDQEYKLAYTGKIVGDKIELSFDMGGRGTRTLTLKKTE